MKVNSIKALAQGFIDAGIYTAYNFPGFHSHDLFSALGENIISVNEKIAYEFAWGSSIAGARTVVTFKNVGLHDAADPFLNSYYTGINAGLVVVVFDDINLTGSQGVFDSRQFRAITGGIWLEPKTIQECYDYAFNSFKKSEESGLPLIIRMSNTNTQLTGSIICSNQQQKSIIPYVKNFDAYVVHPITGNAQFEKWVLKNKNLNSLLDSNSVGVVSKDLLVNTIVFPTVNKKYNTEQHIVTNKFENFYSILRNNNYIVSIDLGGYTADYLKTADMCLCFGASTAVAGGVKNILLDIKVAAVIGDTPFLHSGKNVLPELVLRGLCIDIFVLDNGGSQGTGGQVVPGNIEKEAMIYDVEYVKLYLSEVELTLKKIMTKPERTRVFHILYN